MGDIRIGMIGLDTSHVVAFTKVLNVENDPEHVPGGKVLVAFPGGSKDLAVSYTRVDGYVAKLRDDFGVEMVDSPAAVAERSDAILLESVDGRQHLSQFEEIARFGKPVFIDKPFTTSSAEAKRIFEIAGQYGTPVFSSSSLRFAAGISDLAKDEKVLGCVAHGPNAILPDFPGMFWYGIHSAEILFSLMGTGCKEVRVSTTEGADVVTGTWQDDRIGVLYGGRLGKITFSATVFTDKGTRFAEAAKSPSGYYLMLKAIMEFFKTGRSPIPQEETLEIIRFLEAANEAKATGNPVAL
ncbi:MAG TPA: Gfo/Idh/MocA family oxidoreductase [Firmicutes bacterium]|nr:Gfo/Idh/MocA family oxidoreductase [Bacillota bacterium]